MFNKYIKDMENCMDLVLGKEPCDLPNCADEVKPMLIDFFNLCKSQKLFFRRHLWIIVEEIFIIAIYLCLNTRSYDTLSSRDIISLKKIFEELSLLLDEAIHKNLHNLTKIYCMKDIIAINMIHMGHSSTSNSNYRDGMIFQDYKNLWKVVHRVNFEWDDLTKRGYIPYVFYFYYMKFEQSRKLGTEPSEEEKLKDFMDILDGKISYYGSSCLENKDFIK